MQLVGEVLGQVSDALHDANVPGFDESNVFDDYGRIILEAGGSAAIAAATGGNAGAAAASSVAGNVAGSLISYNLNKVLMDQLGTTAGASLANVIGNAVSTGAGAAVGAAIGGSAGALNGAGIASTINEYNKTVFYQQEAAKKAHLEEVYQQAAGIETAVHEANIYKTGFSDDEKTAYWNGNHINPNAVTDEEYHVPQTAADFAMLGVKDEAGLAALLNHPVDADGHPSNLVGIALVPNRPDNPLTPPIIDFKGTTTAGDVVEDGQQAQGYSSSAYDAAKNVGDYYKQKYQDSSWQGPKVAFGGNSMGGAWPIRRERSVV
ncbi:hypothetical protein PT277_05090 [Acetobacteraceae bacterium ESL0709]|nr:hypothetical protein [Acetobacteraceae bacterium ESL0697]MDF7678070.1 hypothetical protein [Acetobacteraceae bacterium ESL0709]